MSLMPEVPQGFLMGWEPAMDEPAAAAAFAPEALPAQRSPTHWDHALGFSREGP